MLILYRRGGKDGVRSARRRRVRWRKKGRGGERWELDGLHRSRNVVRLLLAARRRRSRRKGGLESRSELNENGNDLKIPLIRMKVSVTTLLRLDLEEMSMVDLIVLRSLLV